MICLDALGKLTQLWEGSTYEDRNRMAHNLFDHLIFDLDTRRIVDFKLKLWANQFVVVRAATLEDEEKYGKCDSGRDRTFDTPLKRRVLYR